MNYRYIMSGSFTPQNKEYLNEGIGIHGIDIPSPYIYGAYDDAMRDEHLAYRFGRRGKDIIIHVFPRESCKAATDDKGQRYLNVKIIGPELDYMDYDTFRKRGGKIYNLQKEFFIPLDPINFKNDLQKIIDQMGTEKKIEWDPKDFEVKASFNELFPNLYEDSPLVYIDNDSYQILTVEP